MGIRYNRKQTPPGWELVDEWVLWLRARGLRAETIRVKRQHLMQFARANRRLQPHTLTVEAVLSWASGRQWRPETRHHFYGNLTQFMTWERKRRGDTRPVEFPLVRRPRTLARPVPDHLLDELVQHPDPRVTMAVRLAAFAGLRRGEIPLVQLSDLIEEPEGRTLLVHGKGGVERLVPVAEHLDAAIRHYQETQGITRWLFPGLIGGHISATWIGKLVNSELPKPWTLHGLRHRFATTVYQQTKDLIVVQQLLGHASVATTQRYLAFTPDALRAAVNAADARTRTQP
ncbi:MAG: tyrosine-type recombinase/integrase [Propionibacteriaceae bacterium]|nr:tyrosine-type recombinase/integrase [Propionibacteriaceae bacterium]